MAWWQTSLHLPNGALAAGLRGAWSTGLRGAAETRRAGTLKPSNLLPKGVSMMGQSSPRRRPSALDRFEDWLAHRNAHVQRLAAGAHAVGRQVWAEGNKLGQHASAARPSDVAALGARAMRQLADGVIGPGGVLTRVGDAATRRLQSAAPAMKRAAAESNEDVLAELNGAQDAFTFGIGDRAYAGSDTDYIHDVAHNLGKAICGYRADDDEEPFKGLRKAGASPQPAGGKPTGFLARLLGFA